MTSRRSSTAEDTASGQPHPLRRAAGALAAALLLAAACGTAPPDETVLERIERTGIVRVGYANEAPYAFLDPATGRVTGEAPEVARAALEGLGVERVEGVLTEFGSLIPGLQAGRFDLIAAGMYVTPARCREIAFSRPTYCIGEAFVVRAGNPLELHGYGDVAERESARLGVVAGTVERGYARRLGVPDDRVVVFPDAPTALAAVEADRIDAYAGTSLTVEDLLSKRASPGLERADPFRQPELDGAPVRGCGAFGFRLEDAAFRAAVDRELDALLGTDRHLALVEPFGFGPGELPGDVTADELCNP